jgi:lipopolysaccharide biosynthesis regulator YciM
VRFWQRRRGRVGALGDPSDLLHEGLLAALDGDTDRVEALLGQMVARDSDDVAAYLALARLYRGRGEVGRAISLHQTLALRRDLTSSMRLMAISELAADFRAGGYLRRAVASYEEVLEYDRRDERALEALSALLPETGEHAQGLVMLRRLARVRGSRDFRAESAALVRMASASVVRGRPDVARRILKRAIRRDARNAAAHLCLGEIEAARGKRSRALNAWRRALEIDGGSRDVYARLEIALPARDHADEWVAFLRERLSSSPGDTDARLELARHLSERGEADEAVAELRRARGEAPDRLETHLELGKALLSMHRDMDAVKGYGELLAVLEARVGAAPGPAAEDSGETS